VTPKKPAPPDEIAIGPEISPGVYAALRRRNGEVQRVLVRLAQDGKPIQPGSELVIVGDSSCECGHWRKLESVCGERSGPAQVTTPAYRDGYDRIFGKQKVGIS
jgi:chemotaxis response regulator CheB